MVLGSLFAFLFWVGGFLSTEFTIFWSTFISPVISGAIHAVVGTNVVASTLIWGFDAGISAALAVGIPYVLTFYFLLAVLEDTGYLNSVAFLTDRVMHKFGLHVINHTLVAERLQCPRLMAPGASTSGKDHRRHTDPTVPCSARTAVILGAYRLFRLAAGHSVISDRDGGNSGNRYRAEQGDARSN